MRLKLLNRWVFPDYPRSLKIKDQYYAKGCKLTVDQKEKLMNGQYTYGTFRNKQYLYDKDTAQRVIKPSQGIRLNGQNLYNGTINEFDRAKLVLQLKAYFGELLASPKQFPLFLRCTFLCPEDQIGDLDNARWFYEKVFIDALKNRGYKKQKGTGDIIYLNFKGRPLPDDKVKYLSTLLQQWYNNEKTALVFELYERYDIDEDKNRLISAIFEQTGIQL